MKEMFEASVDGQAFDSERWGQYFRPAGMAAPNGEDAEASVSAPAPAVTKVAAAAPAVKVEDEDNAPVAESPVQATANANKAQDILAMIRARQNKS
jgi:hypothetical protein